MRQTPERIMKLVDTIDLGSSSLKVQSTSETIETARVARPRPTRLTPRIAGGRPVDAGRAYADHPACLMIGLEAGSRSWKHREDSRRAN